MSDQQNDGGPAFPQAGYDAQTGALHGMTGGMSLRDWFAGQALIGVIVRNRDGEQLSSAAYAIADAMLKAREGAA